MKIGLRILLGYFLIVALAALLVARVFVQEIKPGVRQAMEDTLVDTANLLAELAGDDLAAGTIADGKFAQGVRKLRERDIGAEIWGFDKRQASYRIYVTDARGIVRFDSAGVALGKDYSRWNDVYLTLRGEYGARSTRSDPDDESSSVMHVAAPVRDATGRIIGVLTVAKPNRAMAPFIARSQQVVMRWGWVLMGTALLVGLVAAWWLSRQLGALRRYADAVAGGERVTLPHVAGEFGDLGRALETMRAKLEGKQYVEQYVHSLTHELKGPLAAIRGAAELLESSPGTPMAVADRERFIASIGTQSERLALMIDKLLALAAVEHRQRLERPESMDAAGLLQEVASDATTRLEQAQVALDTTIHAAIPAVRGDAFLLRQALDNLLDNAIDFAPPGSRINMSLQTCDGGIRFDIDDRGPGIPDYAQSRVFERFYSLPRPDGGSRSSGLGLCFVAEVAALHGGHVTLDNRVDGGARASLFLPTRLPVA